jgi:hypothetical protein
MDNLDFSRRRFCPESEERPFDRSLIETAFRPGGVYVFDFHPIHLLLNTPDPEWYMARRDAFLAGERIAQLRFDGYGARSFFDDLVHAMHALSCDSLPIIEALCAFVGEDVRPRDVSTSSYKFDEARLGL